MPRLLRRQLQFPRGSRRFSSVPSALSTSSLVEHWPNVSVVQDGITMLHSATGLPWWASIVASTLIFRAALVLPAGNSMATSRKFALIAPKVNQLALELKEKVNQGNISREDQVQFMQKRSEILNKYRIKQSQMFLPIIYQGFFFSTMFFALRSPNLPILDPSYSHGGFYSFVDLASQDTTYFLATANAVVLFANLYVSSTLELIRPAGSILILSFL